MLFFPAFKGLGPAATGPNLHSILFTVSQRNKEEIHVSIYSEWPRAFGAWQVSWVAWARTTPVKGTSRLILFEVARLADTRGVAVVTLKYLMDAVERSRTCVKYALSDLEKGGFIVREKMRDPQTQRWTSTRIQLLRSPVPISASTATTDKRSANTFPAGSGLRAVRPVDSEGLRELLQQITVQGWGGQAAEDLGSVLASEGPGRFARTIRRRAIFNDATDVWDTLSVAWKVAQDNLHYLVKARDPWALWVTAVSKECSREDASRALEKEHGVTSIDAAVLSEMRIDPLVQADTNVVMGIDDFGDKLKCLVRALSDEGIAEPRAWAIVARILEDIPAGETRRHWLAGRDARLHDLGVNEEAARKIMTAVAGSRRGTQGTIVDADETGIYDLAREIVKLMNAQHLAPV